MLQSLIKSGFIVVIASFWSVMASAGLYECPNNEVRVASLDSAEACFTGTGNAKASDIQNYYDGVWKNEGELTKNGTNDYLTVTLLTGSWGDSGPISGTWAIDSSFWTEYGQAVLSIHVGNGKWDPDHFAWLVTEGATSGTWYYEQKSEFKGSGGLSNMKLWGSGVPAVKVSEPGVALLLMLGLLSMFVARRRA